MPQVEQRSRRSLSDMQDGRNFPTKLHQCLTELERSGLGHIASFQPHGRSFLVHKQEEFVRRVLPRYAQL
jgi:HSF-type DNA-binding